MTDGILAAAAFALLLIVPIVRGAFTGSIDAGSAVARALLAAAVAWAAVALVRGVIARQTQEMPVDEPTAPVAGPPGESQQA